MYILDRGLSMRRRFTFGRIWCMYMHSVAKVNFRPLPCFMLIKRKIQFTQGNSKITIILNNAHHIFWCVRCWNFPRTCISYGNAYLMQRKRDSHFFACVLLEYKDSTAQHCHYRMGAFPPVKHGCLMLVAVSNDYGVMLRWACWVGMLVVVCTTCRQCCGELKTIIVVIHPCGKEVRMRK